MNLNTDKIKNGKFVKFIKDAFIIDFSKPLSIKNQFMVMFVTLFVSTVLFTVVYFINNSQVNAQNPAVSTQGMAVESSDSKKLQSSSTQQSSVTKKKRLTVESTELLKKMTTIEKEHDEIYNGDMILVNKDHDCHHDGEDVVSLLNIKSNTYIVADDSVRVDKSIVDNVNRMFDDFYDIYGETDVMMACGYRSSSLQEELYTAEANAKGSETADSWVAPPGYSEHQTGFVFDLDLLIENGTSGIDYDGEGVYSWINTNCYRYGFILRYLQGKESITGYEYEPWHFRYVGVPAATYIMSKGITFEEYMQEIQKCSYEKPLVIYGDDGEIWCTYYVKAEEEGTTDIPVPQDYDYKVSGDNFSGFIVTVSIEGNGIEHDESNYESLAGTYDESKSDDNGTADEPYEPVYDEEPTENNAEEYLYDTEDTENDDNYDDYDEYDET